MAISHFDITLDWLEAEYVYQPKPVVSNASIPKVWSIADIDDSDFQYVKVKYASKAERLKDEKRKQAIQAMKASCK